MGRQLKRAENTVIALSLDDPADPDCSHTPSAEALAKPKKAKNAKRAKKSAAKEAESEAEKAEEAQAPPQRSARKEKAKSRTTATASQDEPSGLAPRPCGDFSPLGDPFRPGPPYSQR